MGTVVSTAAADAAPKSERNDGRRATHSPRHAAAHDDAGPGRAPEGALGRLIDVARTYLPRGNTLDQRTFERRHLFLCWVLALHVPALFALGVWRGYGILHVALELAVPVACVAFARMAINRRLAAFFVTAGLVYCSVVLVHLSGGTIEAHFHFFILIGLIALYQDWVPFLWNVVFTVLSHGLGSAIGSSLMFNHDAAQSRPWTWATLHGLAVLAACVGVIIFWKHTEQEQERNVTLVADLAAADAERREAMSELLVNLARRNQSLLNRQLEVITDLEVRERQPDVLEELFRLDHLATRIRRNAESLLVLSGDDPARRWGNPVPLGDVVRAAAAEVEDYRRVEVLVNDHIEVAGRAVADLAHLLAELIENATTFSPPSSDVRVRSHLAPGEQITSVISIEDSGIGMPEDDLRTANALLAEAPEVDLGRSTMLGFHVVARLSQRYGLSVRLAATPGGGVTAMVTLPNDLISEREVGADAPPGVSVGGDRYQRAAMARSRSGQTRPLLPRLDARAEHLPDVQPAVLSEAVPPWRELEPPRTAPLPGPFDVPSTAASPPPEPVADWLAGPGPTPSPTAPAAPAPPAAPAAPAVDWATALSPAPAASAPAPPPASDWATGPPAAARPDRLAAQPLTPSAPDTPPASPATPTSPAIPTSPSTPVSPSTPASMSPPAWWFESEALLPPGDGTNGDGHPGTGPGDGTGDPLPAAVVQELSDGLVRRVPGAHLAPALRRDATTEPLAAPASPAPRDRDQVRSMLSDFQASQRAGRAATDPPPPDRSPQENR